jgi:hypothetical protein
VRSYDLLAVPAEIAPLVAAAREYARSPGSAEKFSAKGESSPHSPQARIV